MDVYLSESDDKTLLLVAMIEDEEHKRYHKRKCWVHKINKERDILGEYATLMLQLKADPRRFFIYFRIIPDCFDEILGWISDEICKMPTNFLMPIPPSERLAIALRFFATGDSYSTIGHSFCVCFSTASKIVVEVSEAIIKIVGPMFLSKPTIAIWKESSNGFYEKWQFPKCIAVVLMGNT